MTERTLPFLPRASLGPVQAFHQAIALQQDGRLWEAEQLFAIVLKADDRHFGALHRLGLIRLQQSKLDEAARLFRRAVKANKDSADARHYLGFALTGLGRAEEAIRHYQKALSLEPGVPEIHNNFGYALQVLGRLDEAISQYEKALSIRPTYSEARNNLGNALHLLDRSEEAIAHYRKALEIRPHYAEAYFNIGTSLRALGRNDEAILQYEKAIAIRPNYAEAHNSLGNALDAAHRHEDAIAQYEKAIAIRPAYADAHVNLGMTLWGLGRQEEAIPHYEKVLAISPNYVETLKYRDDALTVLLALTHLPEPILTIDALAQIENLVRKGGPQQADFESLAGFIRAKVLDKANRHAEAWQQFVSANRTLFLANQADFIQMRAREAANLERLRNSAPLAMPDAIEEGHPISLFILGPSRSGKTTMEKLVSALEGVKRGYEDGIVEDTVRRAGEAAGLPSTIWIEDLPRTLHSLCRNLYTKELARRMGSARIFTNTYPIRIHNADLIADIFPNARFLCIKRDVEDNVLRIYMRKYRVGNIYGYDLKATRDHVVWYHDMMDLLAQKLPALVRVIRYEDMVADPAAALRTAADLCSLPMDDRPLPALGDDRNAAAPYRQFITAELEAEVTHSRR
jgi:tetratricopeptide (TPR) repeat protein